MSYVGRINVPLLQLLFNSTTFCVKSFVRLLTTLESNTPHQGAPWFPAAGGKVNLCMMSPTGQTWRPTVSDVHKLQQH